MKLWAANILGFEWLKTLFSENMNLLDSGLLVFYFEDSPVGYFQEPEFPATDGRYSYMSFKGPGHYEMVQTCLNQRVAVCFYIQNVTL